jgi:hypothetical protein
MRHEAAYKPARAVRDIRRSARSARREIHARCGSQPRSRALRGTHDAIAIAAHVARRRCLPDGARSCTKNS